MNYKETEFNDRIIESQELLTKHPDKIPVIVNCSNNIFLDKRKYLVPSDLNCSKFLFILRKRIKINPEEALFMFVKNILLISSTTIGDVYNTAVEASSSDTIYININAPIKVHDPPNKYNLKLFLTTLYTFL